MRLILLILIFVFLPAANDLALAQKEKKRPIAGQYKRLHQRALKQILAGDFAAAGKSLKDYLQRDPADGESHYMLAEGYVRAGDMEAAVKAMQQAIKVGLPAGRFAAGADSVFLDGLSAEEEFQRIVDQFGHVPVHGPMLGCVTDKTAKIWVRTAQPASVAVNYAPANRSNENQQTETVYSKTESDHTAIVTLANLESETTYIYSLEINGQRSPGHSFYLRTGAPVGAPARFKIAFGGGAGYVPPNERVWTTIAQQEPDAVFLLGDNVYSDDPTTPEMQRYCYYRRQSRPEFRRLVSKVPVYAIWDDHDFGTNDCWGGPDIESPAWKRPVWEIFKQNWNNPAFGGDKKQPGCWYDFHIGSVHFIMLDGRYYRTSPREKPVKPSMLGSVQKQWLLDTVQASNATFKVLVSPVPWTFHAKGGSPDTWNGYRDERNEIFSFLTKNKIDGVLLMSADRHRSDLWKIDRPNDYALYEMNSSRLTNQHVHGTMKAAVFSYNAKQSFGVVHFDTTVKDPTVRYEVVTIDGDAVHSFELKKSQLVSKS